VITEQLASESTFHNLVGRAQSMVRLFQTVRKLSIVKSNVLIIGESGTGKELFARAIHYNGTTRDKPFVPVNCGGIPETLVESELFGYRRGAFTGALRDKIGFFEAANGGTLFLDEISVLPMAVQSSLLRAVEEKSVVPESSPVRRVEDLAGRSIAMVKTTLAGDLFPIYAMHEAGLLKSAAPPRVVWVGTHDEVILETLAGRVDAGAVKNLRLDAFEATHPDVKIRRLATSDEVPNDALVVRGDLGPTVGAELRDVLLAMEKDPEGAQALKGFGAVRFVPCRLEEFATIYRMIEALGDQWERLGIDGPPPQRPSLPAGL
jgi:hypothetical protein